MAHYQARIDALHRQKLLFNEEKLLQHGGSYDTDDHGWIPLQPTRDVTRFEDPTCHKCTGMDAVSRVFEDFLDAHPCYAHPLSAVAGCWIGNLPYMNEGWRPEHLFEHAEPLMQRYNITSRGHYAMNHSAPDLAIGLSLGWGGLLEKIRKYRSATPKCKESAEFYDGEERLLMATQRYIARTAAYCREQAAASEGFEKQNLLFMAEMNEYLVSGAPRSLREAVQWMAWYDDIDRMYFNGGAGQEIDTLLYPFYQRDKDNGLLTDDEEAVWYFSSLFFNDPHYHMIGGQNPVDGSDVSNSLSFLVLEGQHRLRIPNNLALRIHENTNEELFTQAVKNLFEDGTGVCYSLANGLDKGFMRNGHPAVLARMRSKVGCNWTALPGIEYALQDVTRLDLAKPLLLALEDFTAPKDGETVMDCLWRLYSCHIETAVQIIKDGVDWHVQYKRYNKPELVLNLLSHGPIERGMDMSAGGVDLMHFACDGVALATAANSFAAIAQRIVQEKRLTLSQLKEALAHNFDGFEDIRLLLKNVPQYGAGNTLADDYALRISQLYTNLMRNTPTHDGFTVLPGIFSHGDVYMHGRNLGATPNGRFAGEPISHSADPDPGFLPGGGTAPTAKANAVARVQSGWGNSTPLQVDIDAKLAAEMGGVDIIKAYICTHNAMGGTLININVISKEKILEAHADPLKYPDLVVRVTGYSAFFRSLSPVYRQQVVDRWLAV